MAILTVGAGQQYSTIAAAVNATQDGDTVRVMAGTYVNDFATIRHAISMESVGGMAVLQATVAPPNGKAILTTDANLVITGFGFTGAAVADGNGAGIRYDTGDLTVRNCVFWNNQDGILANGETGGHIVIDGSEFSHNGSDDGYTHNLYIGSVASLVVQNSYFHDALGGHEVKSRAYSTTIVNNRIFQNGGDGSYAIDIPNGGVAVVQGNVIEKGVNAPNWITIHYGGESPTYPANSLLVTGNTIVNDNPNGYLLTNNTGVTAVLSNNSVWGYAADRLTLGPVTQLNETTLAARPTLDLTTRAPNPATPVTPTSGGTDTTTTTPTTTPTTTHVPDGVVYTSFGIAGAVTASGHILTVGGTTGQFRTLAQALAVSVDGDTIQVAAGTYTNDFGTVNHKVIIEGVGGIASFVQQDRAGAPGGILVVNTDATLKNLSFQGATNYSGREGGVAVYGGNVTVVNSSMSYNDIGIVAADNPAITVSIYGSDFYWNGNGARATHNLFFGSIGSLTIKDSVIHGATTGHELFDHAYNSDIEGNRFFDNNAATSFGLDLGYGGNAVIKNNVIEKGVNAVNGILIQLGGDGAPYDNTNVAISGNTLISDIKNDGHPYTYFINAVNPIASVGPVTVSGNTFVGGVAGSRQAINVTPTGSVVAGSAALDTTSPVSGALAPASMAVLPKGPNTLTLQLTEKKDFQDAQFVVQVDGVSLGGAVVTANHGTDAPQSFTFKGAWGAGPHTVTVLATNILNGYDIYAAKLFVDGLSMDGTAIKPGAEMNGYVHSYTTTMTGKAILPTITAAPATSTSTATALLKSGASTVLASAAIPGSDDALSVALVTDAAGATGGRIAMDATGQITYTVGTVTTTSTAPTTITYRVTDTVTKAAVDAQATITLKPIDPPVVPVAVAAPVAIPAPAAAGAAATDVTPVVPVAVAAVTPSPAVIVGPDSGVATSAAISATAVVATATPVPAAILAASGDVTAPAASATAPVASVPVASVPVASVPVASVPVATATPAVPSVATPVVTTPSTTATVATIDAATVPPPVPATAAQPAAQASVTVTPKTTNPSVAWVNGKTGQSGATAMDAPGAGAPGYLQNQFIYSGSDDMAMSIQAPNTFIHTGSGNDAIQVASGQNVLDGGTGSNFLTGGTGTDTFFTDARSAAVVWNTLRNFHAGDAATLWGFVSGVSSYRWEASAGAAGSEGATLRANIVGGTGRSGDGIDASITFTGMSLDQARGLQIVSGSQAAGSYLYLYNPGV